MSEREFTFEYEGQRDVERTETVAVTGHRTVTAEDKAEAYALADLRLRDEGVHNFTIKLCRIEPKHPTPRGS